MRIYHFGMFASWVRAQFEHVPSVNLPSAVQVLWGLALFALVFTSVFFGSYWFLASITIFRLLLLIEPSGESVDPSFAQSSAYANSRKRRRPGANSSAKITWHYAHVLFSYEYRTDPGVTLAETITMQVYGECPKAAAASLRKLYPERTNISVTQIQRRHC